MAKTTNKKLSVIEELLNINVFKNKNSLNEKEFIIYYRDSQKYYEYSRQRAYTAIEDEMRSAGFLTKLSDLAQNAKLSNEDILKEAFNTEFVIIEDFSYKPSEGLVFEENGLRYLNIYNTPSLIKKRDLLLKDFKTINKILNNLVSNDDDAKKWVINWLAGMFQQPLRKVTTACIFHGDHGTGKGLLFEKVMSYILESNYNKVGFNQISSEFTSWLKNKQFILCNEIMHYENKQEVSQSMKDYISEETFSLREMRRDPRTYPNYSRIIIASNGVVPFQVEIGDRRFSAFKSKKLKNGQEIYNDLIKNMKSECTAFLNYLMELDIDWTLANTPYKNVSREEIIKNNMDSCQLFVTESKELEKGFIDLAAEMGLSHFSFQEFDGINYCTYEEIFNLYKEYAIYSGFDKRSTKNNLIKKMMAMGYDTSKKYLGEGKNKKQHRVIRIEKENE